MKSYGVSYGYIAMENAKMPSYVRVVVWVSGHPASAITVYTNHKEKRINAWNGELKFTNRIM